MVSKVSTILLTYFWSLWVFYQYFCNKTTYALIDQLCLTSNQIKNFEVLNSLGYLIRFKTFFIVGLLHLSHQNSEQYFSSTTQTSRLRRHQESLQTVFPIWSYSVTSATSDHSRSRQSCLRKSYWSAKQSPGTWWSSRLFRNLHWCLSTKRLLCCQSTFHLWSGKELIEINL